MAGQQAQGAYVDHVDAIGYAKGAGGLHDELAVGAVSPFHRVNLEHQPIIRAGAFRKRTERLGNQAGGVPPSGWLAHLDVPCDLQGDQEIALMIMLQQPLNGREVPPLPRKTSSAEHTSELQSLMRNSYAVLCLKT